jgi:hypothetical protein
MRWLGLAAVSVAAFVATAVLLIAQVTGSSGPSTLVGSKPVAQKPLAICGGEPNQAQVSLVIRRFDLADSTLHADIYMCLPQRLVNQLEVLYTDAPGGAAPVKPAEYPDIRVGIEYRGVRRDTTLAALIGYNQYPNVRGHPGSAGNHTVWVGEFPFPITGTARRYPFDWHAARGRLVLNIPEIRPGKFAGVVATPSTRERPNESVRPDLPFTLTVLDRSSARPFTLSARVAHPLGETEIDLQLTRSPSSIAYVVVVVVVAVIIALLFALVLFNSSSLARKLEALVGVAAVLLAILPIRAVLVPGDIGELTFVDYALAVIIAFIAMMACLAVAVSASRDNG